MPFTRPSLKRHLTTWEPSSEWALPANTKNLVFHYGRERGVLLEDVDDTLLLLLSLLDGQHTFSAIVTQLQAHNADITAEDVADNLESLRQSGLIEDAAVTPPAALTELDLERYQKQVLFFSALDASGTQKYEMQARLKQARVTILGLGGSGSHVAMGLAASGVGYIRGVDFDRVELSNLSRQVLYDMTNLGQPKAQAAAAQIQRFNPEITFEPVECQVESAEQLAELIKGTDLVALCADIPSDMPQWMNQASLKTGIPFISGTYQGAVADIGPFVVPHMTSCLACNRIALHHTPDELAWTRDRNWRSHPNVYFVTATSANLIVSEIIKHITGFARPMTYNTRYLFSFESFAMELVELPRDEGCQSCGTGINSRPAAAEGCVNCGGVEKALPLAEAGKK